MENYFTFLFFNFLDNKFQSFFSDFSYVVYGILSLIFSVFFVILLLITYKKLRKEFPLTVNCWFCNNNTRVPYEIANAWECPHCEQYNGFNEESYFKFLMVSKALTTNNQFSSAQDGDYNKVIPEQYNYKLNEVNFKAMRTSVKHAGTLSQNNGFCKSCNINQQLKVQQLASFVPLNENNYYEEIEEYREKLEKAYRLCLKCEKILQETMEKQEYNLLQNKLNSHKQSKSSQRSKILTKFGSENLFIFIKKSGILGLKVICTTSAILLFLAIVIHFETENQFLSSSLQDAIILESLLPVLKVLKDCKHKIYDFKRELSFLGLVCQLTPFENQINKNCLRFLAWGFLHLSCWSVFTGVQLVTSGICLFLDLKGTKNKFIYLHKKSLPKKSGFQPVKQVFSENYNTLGEPSKTPSPLIKSNISGFMDEDCDVIEKKKIKEKNQKLNVSNSEEKGLKHNENELESLPNEEKEKPEPRSVNLSRTGKSFSPSVEADGCVTAESFGPVSEVYDILNGLQLGGKKNKSKKPPNFLFANHNFSDVKTSPSIIKPAKFIKNLNSNPWTDSNECNSRSSTPSSGYFSHKPEKVEPFRYDFPKTISPISVNPFSRPIAPHCFDYYEGNHGFFNNINCFSPGYMPFQQFPSSLGHTAIYTCTRPTNFPYPFSPCQVFSGQKFSPTSRFSDTSDCDNLFQESSKRFARNSRWLKLKTILYYFSIFLNFTTLVSLVYFTSVGIISVDWKLPKLDFLI